MLGLDRSGWPEDGPVVGPDAKIDGSNINAYSLEDFNLCGEMLPSNQLTR
jgi:hypothetical protein